MSAELTITGPITDETLAVATKQIAAARGRLKIIVNSPGGSVPAGLAIYDVIRGYRNGPVTTIARGLAASMGSIVFLAGDRRLIERNALCMIHHPWMSTVGNATDHRTAANVLDKFGSRLVAIYTERAALATDDVLAMLDAETWFDSAEAVAAGFAHEVAAAPAPAKAEVQPAGSWSEAATQALLQDAIVEIAALEKDLVAERRKIALLEGALGVRGVDPAAAITTAPSEFGQRPGEDRTAYIRRQYAEMEKGPQRLAFFERHKGLLLTTRS